MTLLGSGSGGKPGSRWGLEGLEGLEGRAPSFAGANRIGFLSSLLPGALFCPLFPETVTAASMWRFKLASNCVTSFCLEQPLGLCLRGTLEAFEARVRVSSVWGQKEHKLTFPWLSVALFILEFACLLVLYDPPSPQTLRYTAQGAQGSEVLGRKPSLWLFCWLGGGQSWSGGCHSVYSFGGDLLLVSGHRRVSDTRPTSDSQPNGSGSGAPLCLVEKRSPLMTGHWPLWFSSQLPSLYLWARKWSESQKIPGNPPES